MIRAPQKTLRETDLDEAKGEWLGHPFTQHTRGQFEKSAKSALKQLLADCATSADPKVRHAYARYVELESMVVFLTKGNE